VRRGGEDEDAGVLSLFDKIRRYWQSLTARLGALRTELQTGAIYATSPLAKVQSVAQGLLAELERQLPEGPLYAPRMPPVALSNTTLAVPAGDMALYPALQLLTCAALAMVAMRSCRIRSCAAPHPNSQPRRRGPTW